MGDFYHIEVNKGGQWYIITYSDAVFLKNTSFKDFGIVLSAVSKAHQTFSVDALGGPLYELSVAVPFTVE